MAGLVRTCAPRSPVLPTNRPNRAPRAHVENKLALVVGSAILATKVAIVRGVDDAAVVMKYGDRSST